MQEIRKILEKSPQTPKIGHLIPYNQEFRILTNQKMVTYVPTKSKTDYQISIENISHIFQDVPRFILIVFKYSGLTKNEEIRGPGLPKTKTSPNLQKIMFNAM